MNCTQIPRSAGGATAHPPTLESAASLPIFPGPASICLLQGNICLKTLRIIRMRWPQGQWSPPLEFIIVMPEHRQHDSSDYPRCEQRCSQADLAAIPNRHSDDTRHTTKNAGASRKHSVAIDPRSQ